MSKSEAAPLEVLIVDDEPLARGFLRATLESMPDVSVAGECGDGVEAVEAIRGLDPDLVLLDVQMPEVDGFDVIERIGPARMPAVIFTTAHQSHTLRAFEVHALDYILKPIDPERLRASIEHARPRIRRSQAESLADRLASLLDMVGRASAGEYAQRITVRRDDSISFVRLEDVDWLEAARNYVRLHVGSESYLVRHTLRGLLENLDPSRFVRIHRSAAVNLDRVREVQPWLNGEYIVILHSGEKLRVGRTWRDDLLKLMH